MPGKINIYSWNGVNVDKNDIQLEDGDLRKAQNATRDPLGAQGSMRKRAGLTKHNSIAAAGAIRGAVSLPLTKPSTRKFVAGRYTGSTAGWNTSTDDFVTSVTTGGPDGYSASATPRLPANIWTNFASADDRQRAFSGRPLVTYKNRIYYAGNDYTLNTTAPTIRVYDGTIDYVLTTIPYSPDVGVQSLGILNMITANGKIYLSTYDGGSYAANTVKTRIFEVDPDSGATAQIGSRFPITPETARVPYALAWWYGRLWCRTYTGGVTATSKTYFIRPGIDDDWTLDNTSAGTLTCSDMFTFQGQLYFACIADTAAAVVRVRNTTGTYSTSKTAALDEGGGTPVMSDFGAYNHFGTLILFSSSLYVSYFNKNAADTNRYARIYKYDGTSWTVVYSPAANATTAVPFHFALVHNSKVYFVSAPSSDTGVTHNVIVSSSDGSAWTDVTTVLDDTSTNTLGIVTS